MIVAQFAKCHFSIGNIDRNEPYDAPANRDDVNDIFEEATNVLEIGDINHSDKTRHDTIYNTNTGSNLDPGDTPCSTLCQHHVPGSGVQVSLQPHPHVLPHPIEEDGLQAGPALTRPNLEICIEAAASDSILPILNIRLVGAVVIQEEEAGERLSSMRTPLVEALRRTIRMEIYLEKLDLAVSTGCGEC